MVGFHHLPLRPERETGHVVVFFSFLRRPTPIVGQQQQSERPGRVTKQSTRRRRRRRFVIRSRFECTHHRPPPPVNQRRGSIHPARFTRTDGPTITRETISMEKKNENSARISSTWLRSGSRREKQRSNNRVRVRSKQVEEARPNSGSRPHRNSPRERKKNSVKRRKKGENPERTGWWGRTRKEKHR